MTSENQPEGYIWLPRAYLAREWQFHEIGKHVESLVSKSFDGKRIQIINCKKLAHTNQIAMCFRDQRIFF